MQCFPFFSHHYPYQFMSDTEILSIKLPSEGFSGLLKLPSDGITGLSMMAPVIGLPIFLHALSGAVVAGIGFLAYSTVSPVAGKILQATKEIPLLSFPDIKQARLEPSRVEHVPITFSVQESVGELC
jgi:hypothetical protein